MKCMVILSIVNYDRFCAFHKIYKPTLIPSSTNFSSLLFLVNLIDCCIPFTFKTKNNSFLDILVSTDIYQFSMTVCRKSNSVRLPPYTPFNHPPQQEIIVFYSYACSTSHIFPDPSNLSNKLNYLKSLTLLEGATLLSLTKP